MTEFKYDIKIPKERVAVLIGTKGAIKRQIEKATKTKIMVDSEDGATSVTGEDPLKLFQCREIVQAVGRGFNPELATQLLKQDTMLEVISLEPHSKKNKLERLRGRIIGEGGKARGIMEELTDTNISVYGKTVAIIGDYEGVSLARRAVEGLISGSSHAHIYRWLETQKKERVQRELVEKNL